MSQPQVEEIKKERTIAAIHIQGFKSLEDEHRIAIRPLTILAGANSSGKSSAIQPLLLLKQTLEATYDPGPLLLSGPNLRFSDLNQIFSQFSDRESDSQFSVGLEMLSRDVVISTFGESSDSGVQIMQTLYRTKKGDIQLRADMTSCEVKSVFLPESFEDRPEQDEQWQIQQSRCFLRVEFDEILELGERVMRVPAPQDFIPTRNLATFAIQQLIHVPGLRGNPERSYKIGAVRSVFPGTFEAYVANVVYEWQSRKDPRLERLTQWLTILGLTEQIDARKVNSIQVELRVGQLPVSSSKQKARMINIADVGFGISQVLPVLVALLVAAPGQLVYLEQPEIHLHPRAQAALAQLLIKTARRGVRVVAETHSSLLLKAIQTRVARGEITPSDVMCHWFQRDEAGETQISSTELDEMGAFGEWPEDFADVELRVESEYLDAVEAKWMGE